MNEAGIKQIKLIYQRECGVTANWDYLEFY